MDAQDTRTAQQRIDQAEGRLAALQEQGIDTAGLNSQLAFARAALAQGQSLDVMAMCEEVLIAAKRLLAQPPVSANRQVKTDRIAKPPERVASGLFPSLGGPDEARDRLRLTEEIRQAVHSDLMPKALSASQLNERIRTTVERTLDERLKSLQENLSSKLDERFQRLAAEPGTAVIAKSLSAEEISAHIVSEVEGRIAEKLDERLAVALPGVVESAVQGSVRDAVNDAVGQAVHQAVHQAVNQAMATVTEAVTAPVRELVAEALAHAQSAPPNLDAIATKLGNDLRSDLDWQVERLAAEKGWVTLADVHSELRTNGNHKPAADSGNAPGFARLEAALVEFVRQTQSQQQQFLNVLQERVEQGTAVVAQNLAKAIAADKNRSSTVYRQPLPNDTGHAEEAQAERDTAAINRATDARSSDEQSALESHQASAQERELDALSMTAQHRAIDTLGDPQRTTPALTSSIAKLPGTRVTGRVNRNSAVSDPEAGSETASQPVTATVTGLPDSPTLPGLEAASADEHSSATRPSTMLIADHTALDLTAQTDQPLVDPAAETRESRVLGADLGTEAIEMTPLPDQSGESSGLVARGVNSKDVRPGTASTRASSGETGKSTRVLPQAAWDGSELGIDQPMPEPVSQTGSVNKTGSVKQAESAHQPTARVAAFETGLRNLVKGEVQRQLGTAAILKSPATAPISAAASTNLSLDELDLRIRAAVRKAVDELPSGSATSTEVRLSVPCDADLRAAIIRSMPEMLQDPAIRQQILGVVAVEAVANPGALGELTGIRAFIRAEVRHAHEQVIPQAQQNDAPTAVAPAALETPTALIS